MWNVRAIDEGLMQPAKPAVDINDLLESFVAAGKSASGPNVGNLVCENCGISYIEFRNQGLLAALAIMTPLPSPSLACWSVPTRAVRTTLVKLQSRSASAARPFRTCAASNAPCPRRSRPKITSGRLACATKFAKWRNHEPP